MSESFEALRDLYQDVILDHGRHPRHAGRLAAFDATAKGDNPMCGDRIQLWLQYAADGHVEKAGFEARGCAISVASADLMAEIVAGASVDEVRALFSAFRDMARHGSATHGASEQSATLAEKLERLRPLAGVHEFPSRVKCATLPWHALIAAIEGTQETSSE